MDYSASTPYWTKTVPQPFRDKLLKYYEKSLFLFLCDLINYSRLPNFSKSLIHTHNKLLDQYKEDTGEIWYNFYNQMHPIRFNVWDKVSKICPDEFSSAFQEKSREDILIENLRYKVSRLNENQAIHIFKAALSKICYDKVKTGEDYSHFRELQKKIYVRTLDLDSIRKIPIKIALDRLGIKHRGGSVYEEGRKTTAYIYVKDNRVHRFSGKEGGGNVIDVTMHYLSTDFKGAVNFLNNLI